MSQLKVPPPDPATNTKKGLTIYTWNINGIRTLDMPEVIRNLDCDVLCLQETKLSREQLDEKTAFIDDYSSFFAFSMKRLGYSGVATYCRKGFTPREGEDEINGLSKEYYSKDWKDYGIGCDVELDEAQKSFVRQCDLEGRTYILKFNVQAPHDEIPKLLTVINVYCPRLRDDPTDSVNNTDMKFAFHTALGKRAVALVESGSYVLIVGDLNISHTALDNAESIEPKPDDKFRGWMTELLALGFHDTFRALHPTQEDAFTCWASRTNARQNNYGARIDYILADTELMKYLEKADIHPDIMGSDHCPASATFHSIQINNSQDPLCSTSFFPEFRAKQKKITEFFNSPPLSIPKASSPLGEYPIRYPHSQTNTHTRNKNPKRPLQRPRPYPLSKKQKQPTLNDYFKAKSTEQSPSPSPGNVFNSPDEKGSDDAHLKTDGNDVSPVKSTAAVGAKSLPGRSKTSVSADQWKQVMMKPAAPICKHKEECTLRCTAKKGPNFGRWFFACPRGTGKKTDPKANCGFFAWAGGRIVPKGC